MASDSDRRGEETALLKNESDGTDYGAVSPFRQAQVPELLERCLDSWKHKKEMDRAAADRGNARHGNDIVANIAGTHCGENSTQVVQSNVTTVDNVESQQVTQVNNVESQQNNFTFLSIFCISYEKGQFIGLAGSFLGSLQLSFYIILTLQVNIDYEPVSQDSSTRPPPDSA